MTRRNHLVAGLPERLESVWRDSGLTQEAFARRAGISRKTFGAWLRGENSPSTLLLARIRAAHKVSADYLLFGRRGQ